MKEIDEFKRLVKENRQYHYMDIMYWFIVFMMLITTLLSNDINLLIVVWIIVYLGFSINPLYFLRKLLLFLPYDNKNDKLYNLNIFNSSIDKVIIWRGGKEGKYDVTFIFNDESKEDIRFYDISIQLYIDRIFKERVEVKNKYS